MKNRKRLLAWLCACAGPGLYTPPGAYLQSLGLAMMLLCVMLTIESLDNA